MSLIRSATIFIKEQVREPIGVFWAFGAPLAYMAMFVNSMHTRIDQTTFFRQVGLCLAYIALTTSVFNFGLYLVGRRESGFVRTFLTDPHRRHRFLGAQFLASFAMALGYGAAFLALSSAILMPMQFKQLLNFYFLYACVCALFMFGAILVSALPLTFQAASSSLSIFVTVSIVAGLSSRDVQYLGFSAEMINPFALAGKLISGTTSLAWLPAVSTHAVLLIVAGFYGIAHQRLNPQWSNR
jgi:ABC-2 type transport system permease protein